MPKVLVAPREACFPAEVTSETGTGGEQKFVRKRNGRALSAQ